MTDKQREVLEHVKKNGPVRTTFDRAQLDALCKRGFVTRHQFLNRHRLCYAWTITDEGSAALQNVPKDRFTDDSLNELESAYLLSKRSAEKVISGHP